MAGIAGIICKNKNADAENYNEAFHRIINKLTYSDSQLNKRFSDGLCFAGNVVPIASTINDHYIKNEEFPYHIFVEGLVFINDDLKELLNKKYNICNQESDYSLLPYLYDNYRNEFASHITGWFNIFVYNEDNQEPMLVNDRFGFSPLYYYNDNDCFIFSSKLESILASGLMKRIEIDVTTIAEHLFFNYPLSDYTYVKGIFTLADASRFIITDSEITTDKYWNLGELFDHSPLNKKQSIEAINRGLRDSLNKLFRINKSKINLSITGGWDSRIVLSYLLPEYKNRLNAYSFGSPESEDIRIPELIAENEGLKYTSYKLDETYLNNDFINSAAETIMMSGGTRNYKRTHYLYTIKKIASMSDTLLTGIFGDEVFKVGKPKEGAVISKNAIQLIESDFDADVMIKRFIDSKIPELFNIQESILLEEFKNRFLEIKKRFEKYRSPGEKYFAFRFTINLRKYFGNEANSYNDFVNCYSPFIDYNFLKEFAKTKYMVSRFGFIKPSLRQKAQSSWLYYKFCSLNYSPLTNYPSTRGFSMRDTQTISGIIKILLSKVMKLKTKSNIDGFNTSDTNFRFFSMLSDDMRFDNQQVLRNIKSNNYTINYEDYYSLVYWLSEMQSNYIEKS